MDSIKLGIEAAAWVYRHMESGLQCEDEVNLYATDLGTGWEVEQAYVAHDPEDPVHGCCGEPLHAHVISGRPQLHGVVEVEVWDEE